jgi:hypothetical protein
MAVSSLVAKSQALKLKFFNATNIPSRITAAALLAAVFASGLSACAVTREDMLADPSITSTMFETDTPVATTYRVLVGHARKCFRLGNFVDADYFPDVNRAVVSMGIAADLIKITVLDVALSGNAKGGTVVSVKGKFATMMQDVPKWARDEYACVGRGE